MEKAKIAVIGAGSTYTPELIDGFIKRKNELDISEFCLMDIDENKLQIVGGLAKRMLEANGIKSRLVMTKDLKTALDRADFVVSQFRVGKLDARILDETIPAKYDLIGQETTGIGGFMKAMRTIPVTMDIVRMMEKYCPDAWLINFTNPSGLVAEAVLNYSNVKMIGLCNNFVCMAAEIRQRLPEEYKDIIIDYVGLNHLSWVTGVYSGDREVFLEKLSEINEFAKLRNIPDFEWDEGLIKLVKGYPCSYLTYYYYRDMQLEHQKKTAKSRGEVCKEIEKELLELYQRPDLKEKPAVLNKRGGALYSEAAVSLIDAIANDKNEVHVVNVKNQGVLDFMGDDDVIEIGCNVNKNGAVPIPLKAFDNDHVRSMMRVVKSYEKHAALAGLNGDYDEAIKALLIHPLVGDYRRAKSALDELLDAHREYLPQFFR